MSFPPSFYEQLEDRLNLAVFDTNQEFRMWRLETIKAELGDIPESATLTVTNDGREQLLTYNARTIRIDQYQTIDQIRTRLNLEKIDKITTTVRETQPGGVTKTTTTTVEMVKSPMKGLGQKLGLLVHNAEADAAQISAKADEIDARRQAAVPKVMAGLDSQAADLKDVEDFVTELEKATNA